MTQLLEYLVKLSGSLMIVYLFYWLVLSRLTFYTSNRWYLLGYSLIAFFIPLVDITPVLEQADLTEYQFIEVIPVIEATELSNKKFINSQDPFLNAQNVLLVLIPAGIILMVVRFVIQYFSMLSIRRASQMLSDGDIKIYHTDKNIIPFSFGDSIFLNKNKHSPEDLSEIIRHEFIHVKQKHTVDILLSEWICILNWYNPFAWLIRHDIRQNLEYIADDKVLQNGIDKKEYQYILLKVVGIHKFGIATNFNYASLKKRIAMMNKMKSAKIHFIKFLFVVPLLAVVLLAFRKQANKEKIFNDGISTGSVVSKPQKPNQSIADTTPPAKHPQKIPVPGAQPNKKGYIITIADNHGECIVIIRDKVNTIIKAMTLVDWNANEKEMQAEYGEIPPPPPGAPAKVIIDRVQGVLGPHPAPAPTFTEMPEKVLNIYVKNKKLTLTLKNGKTEVYDLNNPQQKAGFEKKYGPVPAINIQEPNADPNPTNEQNPVIIDKKEEETNAGEERL